MQYENVKENIGFFSEDSSKPLAVLDLVGEIIQVNDSFRKVFSAEKLRNIKELLDDTTMKMWDEFTQIAKKNGRISFYMPIRITSNKINTVEIQFNYCDKENQVIAYFNVPQNWGIEAEMPYLNAFRKSDNFMLLVDEYGTVLDVNEKSVHFFNLTRDFFIGKKIHELINLIPETFSKDSEYIKTVNKHGYADTLKRYELKSGDVRHYHMTTFYDEGTRSYLTRMTDQTENVNLEKRLAYEDALSSVGQLAASIAHEIRNPMTTLKGFTQLLRVSATEESKRYLTVIDDEIVRMESILSEMLILSKPSTNEKETISLMKLVSELIRVIHPKASLEGITIIEKDNELTNDSILGNVTKLKQAIFNLLKNALEAMPWGGVLTVNIEKSNNDGIKLSISDTGKGIDASQLNRIFMPYFTTRAEGTGLGLSFVLKTIEDHGGTISVESELNVGTKFMILFPSAIADDHIVEEIILSEFGWHH